MSFREKIAWISFVSILLVFGIYFTAVTLAMTGRFGHVHAFDWFIELVVALVVLQVVLRVIVARRAPQEAKAPADEREQLIGLKADRVAGYVLTVGVFVAIFTIHLGAGKTELAHAALAAVAVSQLAKYGVMIRLHRRDA